MQQLGMRYLKAGHLTDLSLLSILSHGFRPWAMGDVFCRAADVECTMARARNTASAKDLCKAFRSYSTDLDAARFRDDIDVLIERHEVLLVDILEETRRPTEKVRCQSLTLSYECGRSMAMEIARAIAACFKHIREKKQSATSGKKLTPACWRLVAKLREFDAPGSASKVGSKESLSAEASPASRVIKGRKQATSSTDILACYGLVGSAAKRALEAEFESAAEEVEEEEAESMDCLEISSEDPADASAQHDLAISRPIGKPYFDPSRGKFIQLLENGSEQEGIMSPGPLGFYVVKLPDSEAFESQVPNLFLESSSREKSNKVSGSQEESPKDIQSEVFGKGSRA